jgi:16S rRNA (uracil1498-N3)-methyltransferase
VTVPYFLIERLPSIGSAELAGPEGRHAAVVRRLTAGERLVLTDGAGGRAFCVVTAAGRDSLDLLVEAVDFVPPVEPRVTVVQALPKGDRGELAVELMTEGGVDAIVPWQAARCVTRWREGRGEKALARWRSTAREAAKQARRSYLPDVVTPTSTSDVVELLRAAGSAFVLHEDAKRPLATVAIVPGTVVLVVGPEGGLTPEELAAFEAAGAEPVRLGSSVLRTSTAGLAALAVVSARTARWS